MRRILMMFLGSLALVLGLVGVVLPLLPTTPFVILAAYFFARSSPRLHQWLLNQRTFGPLIRDWEEYGVIPLRAKWLASSMMVVMVSYPLLFLSFALWLKALAASSVLFALWFIWSRPSEPGRSSLNQVAAVARVNQAGDRS